jgi:hypothetical protein
MEIRDGRSRRNVEHPEDKGMAGDLQMADKRITQGEGI